MPDTEATQRRPGRPTREQAASIELSVLRGARRVFRDRGPNASMDDVAQAIGVTKLTIYRRFPSKEDLLLAVIEHDLAELCQAIDAAVDPARPAHDNLKAVARTVFDFMVDAENVPVARALIRDLNDSIALRQRANNWREQIHRQLAPWVEAGLVAHTETRVDADALCEILLDMIGGQSERLRYSDARPSAEAFDRIFGDRWAFFLRGAGFVRSV